MNLFDTLKEALTDEVVSKIAKFVDEDPAKTRKALESINYTLIAGMIKRTDSNMGVNMLYNQVQRGSFNGSIINTLSDTLGKKQRMEEIMKTGDGLLSQLFPAYKSPLTSMIGAFAGIKKISSSTLSCLSAVIVIDALGKQVTESKMDTDDLTNFLIDHHETLFQQAPDDLMEKMIPSLGLQELQSGKFAAMKKIPVQKTPKLIVKPVSSLDRPKEVESSPFNSPNLLKKLALFLVAAGLIGGGIYYYLKIIRPSQETKTLEVKASTLKDSLKNSLKDSLRLKKDTSNKKTDSTIVKRDTAKVALKPTSFNEQLEKYLLDTQATKGSIFDLKAITFPADSPTPDAAAISSISGLADLMKKYPKFQVKILGYATGEVKNLAVKRASAIKIALQDKGIDSNRIDFGSGGSGENKVAIKVVSK